MKFVKSSIWLIVSIALLSSCGLEQDEPNDVNNEQEQPQDFDQDGIPDLSDDDDDNDGTLDIDDAFPFDPDESSDTDNDGIGNNSDPDDDNDGAGDTEDVFPLDPTETLDSDLDGIGNNTDLDDDNDGVNDAEDAFPFDVTESLDTDNDGIGNNADTDDDNDGLLDSYNVIDFSDKMFPTDWVTNGDDQSNWVITSVEPDLTQYFASSEPITDGQSVTITLTVTVQSEPINFGFKYSVSSEEDYDLFEFSINQQTNLVASGETDWQLFRESLPVGIHTLVWSYTKDGSDYDGEDRVWLDDVFFIRDNCPLTANPTQEDLDADLTGDACDLDIDNDSYANSDDAFPFDATEWLDTDKDGLGNNLDNDDDGDQLPDNFEQLFEQLNPLDASDALADIDGDLSSNLEEYQAASDLTNADHTALNSPFSKLVSSNQTNISARFAYNLVSQENRLLVTGYNDDGKPTLYFYEQPDSASNSWQELNQIELPYMPTQTLLVGELLIISDARNSDIEDDSGIVSVFMRDENSNWQFETNLYPNTENTKDLFFGSAITANENYIIVGAYGDTLGLHNHRNTGSVYVFKKIDSSWQFHQKLTASDFEATAEFGKSVTLNNNQIVIGSPHNSRGKAYVFELDESGNWVETQILTTPVGLDADDFGTTITWHKKNLYVSAPSAYGSAGAIIEYELNDSDNIEYTQTVRLSEQLVDQFNYRGFANDILTNGLSLISRTNTYDMDTHYQYQVFNRNENHDWVLTQTITQPNVYDSSFGIGRSAATANHLFLGATLDNDKGHYAGAFYIYNDLPQDSDGDGIVDSLDNCVNTPNPLQENGNGGTTGDACDNYVPQTNLQRVVASDGYDDDYFGADLSVSNNKVLIVGASDNHAAYIFNNINGVWTEQQQLKPQQDRYSFGASVALNNQFAFVGTFGSSSSVVEVFNYSESEDTWIFHSTIDPDIGSSTGFGNNIAIWQNYVFISAHRKDNSTGAVYVYKLVGNTWNLQQTLSYDAGESGDFFGSAIAVSDFGLAIGSPGVEDQGMVMVFQLDAQNSWQRIRRIRPADGAQGDFFGKAVGITNTQLLIGSPRNQEVGAAYLINLESWQQQKLTSDSPTQFEAFGWGVSMTDSMLAVGAINDDIDGLSTGSVYLFESVHGTFEQTEKFAPPTEYRADNDAFGIKVNLTTTELIIGMDTEDGFNRGAVYVYDLD